MTRPGGIVAMLLLILPLHFACKSAEGPLRIAAASSTRFLVEALVEEFEKTTGKSVEVIVASSGKLTAQINQGAPYDLMLSADLYYPEQLVLAGKTQGDVVHYCTGKLVLWSMKDMRGDGLDQLRVARHIAIANPELAPYGRAAQEVLVSVGLWDLIQSKLAFGESIGQVNQFILTGAVDLGFTAQSVVMAAIVKEKGHWEAMDEELYAPLKQGLVILKNGKEEKAEKFVSFMNNEGAKEIFEDFGYTLPQ